MRIAPHTFMCEKRVIGIVVTVCRKVFVPTCRDELQNGQKSVDKSRGLLADGAQSGQTLTIRRCCTRRMNDHDQDLSRAFDSQAPKFERAPVQSDPVAIERLVREAGLPPGGLVLDAGCGPGLVAAALLEAGFRLVGVDLSAGDDRASAKAM